MIEISDSFYDLMAKRLMEEIAECRGDFFSGVVELDDDEYYAELKCSLILYGGGRCDRTGCNATCGSCPYEERKVSDIVPVWWDLNLWLEDGAHPNTFSWSEFMVHMKRYMQC